MLSYGTPNQYIYASIGLVYLKLKDYGKDLLYLFATYNLICEKLKKQFITKKYRYLNFLIRLMDKSVDYGIKVDEIFNLKSQRKFHNAITEEVYTIIGIGYFDLMTGLDYVKSK